MNILACIADLMLGLG